MSRSASVPSVYRRNGPCSSLPTTPSGHKLYRGLKLEQNLCRAGGGTPVMRSNFILRFRPPSFLPLSNGHTDTTTAGFHYCNSTRRAMPGTAKHNVPGNVFFFFFFSHRTTRQMTRLKRSKNEDCVPGKKSSGDPFVSSRRVLPTTISLSAARNHLWHRRTKLVAVSLSLSLSLPLAAGTWLPTAGNLSRKDRSGLGFGSIFPVCASRSSLSIEGNK